MAPAYVGAADPDLVLFDTNLSGRSEQELLETSQIRRSARSRGSADDVRGPHALYCALTTRTRAATLQSRRFPRGRPGDRKRSGL
jgi:hypothetical protein